MDGRIRELHRESGSKTAARVIVRFERGAKCPRRAESPLLGRGKRRSRAAQIFFGGVSGEVWTAGACLGAERHALAERKPRRPETRATRKSAGGFRRRSSRLRTERGAQCYFGRY